MTYRSSDTYYSSLYLQRYTDGYGYNFYYKGYGYYEYSIMPHCTSYTTPGRGLSKILVAVFLTCCLGISTTMIVYSNYKDKHPDQDIVSEQTEVEF